MPPEPFPHHGPGRSGAAPPVYRKASPGDRAETSAE